MKHERSLSYSDTTLNHINVVHRQDYNSVFLIFNFLDNKWETQDSELNNSKHSTFLC
jgi:hypothetical protein